MLNLKETLVRNRRSLSLSTALRAAQPLISQQAGIILDVVEDPLPPTSFGLFHLVALTPHTGRHTLKCRRNGSGYALTRETAAHRALGEALEAYSVAMHWGQVELIRRSFLDVTETALDPRRMSLVSPEEARQLQHMSGALVPFDPHRPMLWTWGARLPDKQPVLVPASMVYMSYDFVQHDDPPIWQPTSSGLACGSSGAAAILSGLLEVIERDALLMAWWNRLPCPRVPDHFLVEIPEVSHLLDRIARRGLRLIVNNVTMETGIPVYMAWLVDSSGRWPAAALGAAAHLNPVCAISKAVVEACQVYLYLQPALKCSTRELNRETLQHNIQTFADHGLLYSYPEMLPSLRFLHEAPWDQTPQPISLASGEADADCQTCLQMLSAKGLEAYVVDLTVPEIASCGFHVVRTLVTGAQHLACLGQLRLLANPRLYRIPRLLGYSERNSEPEHLNCLPHPIA